MALTVLSFANGDTDYISKHNTNNTNIKAAIDALQSAIGASGSGGDSSLAVFYEGLMSGDDSVIGVGSYLPSNSATAHQPSIAAGTAYNEAADSVVIKSTPTTFNLLGQTTGVYYVHVDSSGEPYYDQVSEGSLYSFSYDSATGNISSVTTLGGVLYSTDDLSSQRSNLWGIEYDTTEERIDAAERAVLYVLRKTVAGAAIELTENEAFEHTVLLLEDGPQTDNVVLTVPAEERVYTVINDCTSLYGVTITPSGGTGYAVPGGYFAIVHVTGTDATPVFLMDRNSGASPVNEFLLLDDVGDVSYTGKAGYLARVHSGETAMELWQADFITAAGVTFENLDANGDVGTGAAQVAAGDHAHSGVYEPAFSKNTGFNLVLGTGSGQVAEGDHTHAGAGDVAGPASAVDSSLAAFDTTTGKLIKDSGWTLNDSGTTTSDLWSADKIATAIAAGGGGGVQAFVQLTEPVSPSLGDFWIEAAPE